MNDEKLDQETVRILRDIRNALATPEQAKFNQILWSKHEREEKKQVELQAAFQRHALMQDEERRKEWEQAEKKRNDENSIQIDPETEEPRKE